MAISTNKPPGPIRPGPFPQFSHQINAQGPYVVKDVWCAVGFRAE